MLYNSTQNAKEVVSAAQAIAQGISKDGGLFVPQEFPKYDENTFKALLKTDYKGRAKKVFSDFLSALRGYRHIIFRRENQRLRRKGLYSSEIRR